MNHKEYKKKFLGTRIDYDHAYGYQCIDFVRHYTHCVLKAIGTFGGSAYIGWTTGKPFNNRWRRINNVYGNVSNYPKVGDIVFFKKSIFNRNYGHVAIVDEGTDGNNLFVLEQNAGTVKDIFGSGLGSNAITRRKKSYKNVLGWCRFIG